MTAATALTDSWRQVPHIRRYLAGFGADAVGDLLWFLTLAWAAADSGSGWGGAILFAAVAPTLVLAPLGGALVDRVGVAAVIRWTLSARAVMTAGWALMVGSGLDLHPLTLLLAALCLGSIDGIHLPALETWPLTLADDAAPPAAQTSIYGAERTITRTAQAVAGLGAGELLARWGAVPPAVAAGGLFVAAVLLFSRLPARAAASPQGGSDRDGGGGLAAGARRGMAVVVRDRVLRRTVACHSLVNMMTAGVMLAGLPLLMSQREWSARSFGAAFACWGVGLLAGTLTFMRLLPRLRSTVLLGLCAGALTGLALMAAAWVTTPVATLAAVCVAGVACGPLGPCLGGYLRSRIVEHPDRGAVTGFAALTLSGLEPFGYLAAGGLAVALGPQAGVAMCGLAIVAVCGWALVNGPTRSASVR